MKGHSGMGSTAALDGGGSVWAVAGGIQVAGGVAAR